MVAQQQSPPTLQGIALALAAIFLATANFVVVLDMTIVNVSISHIAGGLAISPIEGTQAITAYAVAEAITVPLTGWLAKRFGSVKVFLTCIVLFAICSMICGISTSKNMLVVGRLLQGLAGGPMMPLSQTLIMQIFPAHKKSLALGIWSITTLLAPIAGPLIGGYISENWSWHYIFLINIPIAAICAVFSMKLLKPFESQTQREKIDFVGLILLIIWVGSLQTVLDTGQQNNWFESTHICILSVTAIIGFITFLIWELTEKKPIVNLHVFRHRGYTASVITVGLAFGAFFGSVVLLPLWLQGIMQYTSTYSGEVSSTLGCLAILTAPIVAVLASKFDPRPLVFLGVVWLGIMTFIRSFANTDMSMLAISLLVLIQGIGLPFFFIPLNAMALGSVKKAEIASAAGLLNFIRTLSSAIATSVVTTIWDHKTTMFRAELSGQIASPDQLAVMLGDTSQVGQQMAANILDQTFQKQIIMLATNQTFLTVSFTFVIAALAVWLTPKPTTKITQVGAH
jgi:DHA2 family multidrug resistance protein